MQWDSLAALLCLPFYEDAWDSKLHISIHSKLDVGPPDEAPMPWSDCDLLQVFI